MFTVVKDDSLVQKAATSAQGRLFWTGGRLEDALEHLIHHEDDVCMARCDNLIVMLGGPIPDKVLVDVTEYDFSHIADSFDVGEMTSMVEQWFQKDFDVQVTVKILESGEIIQGLGLNSKLISLSRKTPALLDMAATENGRTIGQFSSTGTLGHSGDSYSTIGDVTCLHHELPIKPSSLNDVKLYFLAGYSSKPLKEWRDSRVFWIVYDPDQFTCWLVPHDLSHNAVGDTVSATMPLVSKASQNYASVSVIHLPNPVQASLASASPLRENNVVHREYLDRCMVAARAVDWEIASLVKESSSETRVKDKDFKKALSKNAEKQRQGDKTPTTSIDRAVAVFDDCSDTIFESFKQERVVGKSLSPMYGPLKVLASGSCANSRIVVIDAERQSATSEINAVSKQLSGVIFVKTNDPDIFNKFHQTRWDMARAPRTPVLALTSDGCKHICGPMPPSYDDDEHPTPVAGTPISNEAVKELIQFALSSEADDYFGPLYQSAPPFEQVEQEIADYISDMISKDFRAINGKEEETEDSFMDDDFRRLMDVINKLSVSTSTATQRNNLAIKLVKFLQKMSKKTANIELSNNSALRKHVTDLEILSGWVGDNLDWAFEKKEFLDDILKGSSVKILTQDFVEIDLALQTKLNEAITKKRSELCATIKASTKASINSWKKTFNAVFHPAIEAMMLSIGDNPRYRNYFPEIKNPNMSGVIIRACQSSNKQAIAANPEDVMKLFHRMGATGFVSFKIDFLQTWKAKVINEICLVDRPGEGFNNPETYVPVSHRLEDGPSDPVAAYETDVRHQFVLPTFVRLPKLIYDSDEDEDDEDDALRHMPPTPAEADLATYLLMRAEFTLRDPEQGPRHPMWQYVDWLFHQIKTIHQINEKQAAPLAMRALGFSIARLMKENRKPSKTDMEVVASIIQAISFMSARGDPLPHGCIDTFFSMNATYVPQTKDMERNPWQIEVINILSRAVDFVLPLMSEAEYTQIRANFQRAAANMVKRQIVQKLLDDVQEEAKKNSVSHEEYVAQVNNEFYPAYREVVETIKMLIEANPETFNLDNELCERIDVLHQIIAIKWAKSMRRCRVGPIREMVKVLKTFSEKGPQAMVYLLSRKAYLEHLYDQVYHIKYESCDQVFIEEVCKIIRARTRNPEHEKHHQWRRRVDKAIENISSYDERMSGFAHGNTYKQLPTELILKMLLSLKADPASNHAVAFEDIKTLLAHVNIEVKKPADLKVQHNDPDGRKPVLEQLRGAWWMCPDVAVTADMPARDSEIVPTVALIPMGLPGAGMATSSNILATLGDTYHKFKLARLYSGKLQPMRRYIRENYKFHLEWFEETIRAAGFPRHFDPALVQGNETMAIYAIVQRLVAELAEDGSDRGDRTRDRVYGETLEQLAGESHQSALG